MVKKIILNALLDEKKVAIIKTLLSKEELNLKEISYKSQVALSTVYRTVNELVNLNIINRTIWKNAKAYSIKDQEKIEFLNELLISSSNPLDSFIDQLKQITSIQKVLLNDISKTGATVIVIGNHVNQNRLEEINSKEDFPISYVVVTQEQFQQMSKMGLYSGEKKILFSR